MVSDRAPLLSSNVVVDSACLLFAGFTVLCHAVAWSRGSAVDLLVLVCVFLVGAALLGFAAVRRRGREWLAGLFVDQLACLPEGPGRPVARQRLVMGLVALGILAVSLVLKNRFFFWGGIALLLHRRLAAGGEGSGLPGRPLPCG